MSPVSWSEPRLLMWERRGFSRGRNVAREYRRQRYIIDRVTLVTEEHWLPQRTVNAPANYPNSSGQIPWLSVKRRGQLSPRQRVISAIALDKR